MKVNVLSRKLVKPCKPTPSNLRTYKISLVDEVNPSMHVIRILYYSPDHAIQGKRIFLEESLAQVLPHFYPLAGRYNKEKHEVDCNDEGAAYSTAEVDCQLHQLLGAKVEPEQLNRLLPIDVGAADEPTDPMLAVQINRFQWWGFAIGICVSLRIFDSASLGIFLTAWANAAATHGELIILPNLDSASYFPPENLPPHQFQASRTRDKSIVAKRCVFDKISISRLRDRLSTESKSTGSERPPSRVVVVSALLALALLRADRAKHGKPRASLIGQVINVRERTIPPVPKHSCGSWASVSFLELTASESHTMEQDFPGMASKMREAVMQGVKDGAKILSDKEFGRWAMVGSFVEAARQAESPGCKVIWITDFSKFGEYEADFGFGKPVWVSMADVPLKDHFILLNTRDNDGIEAWVYLDESDMPCFQTDKELGMLAAMSG